MPMERQQYCSIKIRTCLTVKPFFSFRIIFFLLAVVSAANGQDIPQALYGVYEQEADAKYSDEFNAKRDKNAFDTSKWHYRKTTKGRPGLGQGQEYVQEKNGKLICYGLKSTRKGGAIVSNRYFQYGFYAFKWRAKGMPHNRRNAWHPSVWGSFNDTKGSKVPSTSTRGDSWMEIDIMEFSTSSKTSTYWNTDAPAYIWVDTLMRRIKVNKGLGPKFGWKKAVMTDGVKDAFNGDVIGTKNHHKWKTLGMEYHPEYLQLWQKEGRKWYAIGHRIRLTSNKVKPSRKTVPRKAAKPLYWIIGNLFLPHGKTKIEEAQITNAKLELDWFRYHQLSKNN